jgi:hypothetical protein
VARWLGIILDEEPRPTQPRHGNTQPPPGTGLPCNANRTAAPTGLLVPPWDPARSPATGSIPPG